MPLTIKNYSEGILRKLNVIEDREQSDSQNEQERTPHKASIYISYDYNDRFQVYEIRKYLLEHTDLKVYYNSYIKKPAFDFKKSLKRIKASYCVLISKLFSIYG